MMNMSKSFVTRWPAAGQMGTALAVALLATAACSSASSTTSSAAGSGASPTPSAAGASSASSAAGTSSAAAATTIMTGSGSAGTFLVDGTGRAVYLWMADSTGKSTCSGACAAALPPVPATGTVTASGGAKASDLTTITRADGSKQAAYDGHALYYFAGDTSAGQTNGQGSNGFGAKWWLVTPTGSAITATTTATKPAGGGY
jgi:predicted lipoprotein with Yx(FWY)xxD motif